jgi:dTMP kinase
MKLGGRGALIIFEGCDRSGKSTQCQRLVKYLNEKNCQHVNKDDLPAAKLMRFPDRTTQSGKEIDSYLQGKIQLDDKKIHLLFSNNRWEKDKEIQAAMVAGQTVIVDRYAFSGVAFSAAKEGMSMEWCREPDRGLPKPGII